MFTDEVYYAKRGITNSHNEHVYSDEKPHTNKKHHFEHEFRLNVKL